MMDDSVWSPNRIMQLFREERTRSANAPWESLHIACGKK